METLNFGSLRPNVYTDMAARITRDLLEIGIPPPEHEPLVDAIVDSIDSDGLRYGFALAGRETPNDHWHLVSWGEAAYSDNLDQYDRQVLPSLGEALTYVIEEIDAAGIIPAEVSSTAPGVICIASEKGPLVTIEPVPYEPANPKARARYRRAFQSVSRRGNSAAIHRALLEVPGYAQIDLNSDRNLKLIPAEFLREETDDRPHGGPLVYSPTSLSLAIGALLHRFNIEIRKARLLELTAHAFGAPSWNVWVAADERTPCCQLPLHMRVTDARTSVESHRFYRCFWEALPEFMTTCSTMNRETPLTVSGLQLGSMTSIPHINATTVEGRKKEIASIKDGLPHYFNQAAASLSAAERAYGAEEFPDNITQVLGHPKGPAQGLREMFQLEAPVTVKSARALSRRGYTLQDVRRWRDYLLVLRRGEGRTEDVLFVEDETQVGSKRVIGAASCYKAAFAFYQENIWVLLGDYQRRVEVVFNGMTDAEAQSIAEFAGFRASPFLSKDTQYLRSKLLAAGVEDHPELRTFHVSGSEPKMEQLKALLDTARAGLRKKDPLIFEGKFTFTEDASGRQMVEVHPENSRGLALMDVEDWERHWPLIHFLQEAISQRPPRVQKKRKS